MIYFVQESEYPNRIKIGYSSNPSNRFGIYTSILKQDIKVLKVIEGSIDEEQLIHTELGDYRVHKSREWYYPHKRLLEWINLKV
jgi:hypothetical protein